MSILVLVTEPEFRRAQATFTSAAGFDCRVVPGSEDALSEAILAQRGRFVVVGSSPYQDRLYRTLGAGGVIARFGVGFDNIDRQRATALGVLCTNTPDVLQQSVAELTVAMIGVGARYLVPAASSMKQGSWTPQEGVELEGKTLALIGTGAIARAVAKIAAAGYSMRVHGYARSPREVPPHFSAVTTDFAEAVRGADFVSLHIPASPENVHFIDAGRMALLEPHCWLINTARGAVVDEAALFEALQGRRLAGAALDVFQREPYVPVDGSRDLRTLDNVVLVPHIGSNTVEANARMARRALRNVQLAAAGELEAMDLINRDVLQGR